MANEVELVVQVRLMTAFQDENGGVLVEREVLQEMHLWANDDEYPRSFIAATYEQVHKTLMDAEPPTSEDAK
jgi:hypothetical protein